jgi:hypothetical protein
MKRIALLVALAVGSQGCFTQARRGNSKMTDGDVAAAILLVGVVVAGTALLIMAASQRRTDDERPQFPLPPEQQPRPPGF